MEVNTRTGKRFLCGFTLIELLVVLLLVSILASIVAPMLTKSILKANESALRENLYVLRKTIDDYYADKGVYPDRLEKLQDERYLRRLPADPVSKGDWIVEFSQNEPRGIIDVRSSSDDLALDGTPYAGW